MTTNATALMRARCVPGLSERIWADTPAPPVERGDFEITTDQVGDRTMWLACPGCGEVKVLAIRPAPKALPSWELAGTPEAPTLHPSIHHVGCWHGWLRAGVLEAV